MSWTTLTGLVVILTITGLILYDLVAYIFGGNDATISYRMWTVSNRSRYFVLLFAFALGVLFGHFFLPQHVPVETPPVSAP